MLKKSYPNKSFRLNAKTTKSLERLKRKTKLSWNLLFVDMINNYERKK